MVDKAILSFLFYFVELDRFKQISPINIEVSTTALQNKLSFWKIIKFPFFIELKRKNIFYIDPKLWPFLRSEGETLYPHRS